MPKNPNVDLDKVELEIKSKIKINSIEREPLAFGLNSLKIVAVVDEIDGASDEAELKLNKIEGIGSVEVISATRDI